MDIVHWRSAADAQAIMSRLDSPACQAFFAVMDMSGPDAAACVDHFSSLAVYE